MNIKEMFDSIASRYDLLNNLISLLQHKRIKKHAIKTIPLPEGAKVLDLCTGTGDIAILLSKIHKNISITAADFSEKMLEIAKKRASKHPNISFMQADAMNLPFENETFDAVFISFGLRNLPDTEKALQEIKRVLKTGGYFVNLDTGKPKGLVSLPFKLFFFGLVPLLGSAYKYLPESTKAFPSQQRLVEMLEKLGFTDVKNHDYIFGAIACQSGMKIDANK